MEHKQDSTRILQQLEEGEIDVEEALEQISSMESEASDEQEAGKIPGRWRGWWSIPLVIGLLLILAGAGLGDLGGFWLVIGIPLMIAGFLLCLFSVMTIDAPWVHVRVDTGEETWPQRIKISLPIPARMISWGVRAFGHRIHGLDAKDIEMLLLGLEENISPDNPIYIEVDEEDSDERVTIYIG